MNIILGIGLVIILLIVFGYKMFPSKRKKRKAKQNKITESIQEPVVQEFSQHPFHCVSIDAKARRCSESKAIIGKRFLSKVAPRLPLSLCDNPLCQCRYVHHDDRREPNSDRRVDFGLPQMLYGAYGEQNRRSKPRGRRITDH